MDKQNLTEGVLLFEIFITPKLAWVSTHPSLQIGAYTCKVHVSCCLNEFLIALLDILGGQGCPLEVPFYVKLSRGNNFLHCPASHSTLILYLKNLQGPIEGVGTWRWL